MILRLQILSLFLVAMGPGIAEAQTVLAQDSPFLPPGVTSAEGDASGTAAFELDGASVTSGGTSVCIYDAREKHSHWIAVGEAEGRIKVVGYDAANDRAEVVIDGVAQALELRKVSEVPFVQTASSAGNGLSPEAPNRMRPPGMVGPDQVARARSEREARMFVTDLLDIGARQRKAHEEAEAKKAQQEGR